MEDNFTIKADDRRQHVYIPGQTQYGKTTLMYWMVLQHIIKGHGVCYIDGKGDAFRKFFSRLIPDNNITPQARAKIEQRLDHEDIIYLDVKTPVPLDFMSYTDDLDKETLVGELKLFINKGTDLAHAHTVDANLTNVILTLLNFNDNEDIKPDHKATFLDIYYFLKDSVRRDEIKKGLTDEHFIQLWKQEIPHSQFTATDIGRITTRMNSFVVTPTLRKIFGDPQPRFNVLEAMQERKILIINVGPGTEIQKIYGTLLLSKIRQAAFLRDAISEVERPENYYLYCDEFQKYQTSDFAEIIAQAGGLGLCLTLANQWSKQLDESVRDAIRTVSTFIIFRIDPRDATAMKDYLPQPPDNPIERRRAHLVTKLQTLKFELDTLRSQQTDHWGGRTLEQLHESKRLMTTVHKLRPDEYSRLGLELIDKWIQIDPVLKELESLPPRPPQLPTLADIQKLQRGEAIYRAADSSVRKIRTPSPPKFSRNYAEPIRISTVKNYGGQILPKAGTQSSSAKHEEPPTPPTFTPPHPTKRRENT